MGAAAAPAAAAATPRGAEMDTHSQRWRGRIRSVAAPPLAADVCLGVADEVAGDGHARGRESRWDGIATPAAMLSCRL